MKTYLINILSLSLILSSTAVLGQHIDGHVSQTISGSHGHHSKHEGGELKEHKVSFSSGTLNIADMDDLKVVGYDGNEVIVSTMVQKSHKSDRTAGLKLVNSLGLEDNTGFGVSVVQEGNILTARQLSGNCNCNEVLIKVPKAVKVSISHNSHSGDKIEIENISSELEISTNHQDINLTNVTGPMAVKSVHGKIEGAFKTVSQEGSISLYSAHGFIDVTIPNAAKLNLTVKTPFGDVYSNANIDISSTSSQRSYSGGTGTIKGTLNGGGVEFNIKSSHGDIYLRQGS